ncbi:hypothetical protein BCR34DRAFT_597938 [Clohesyomyces aquaticus]|uniref:Uncharacterized protein n=1 Tax=Clohesyomyces aquaticus TaxID=1231657 RepID=A0A1Y2A0V7_9PLEO|nr:hypothetical protein BCR34DRAFT_597938 [Clohesyomyces aquaticus]
MPSISQVLTSVARFITRPLAIPNRLIELLDASLCTLFFGTPDPTCFQFTSLHLLICITFKVLFLLSTPDPELTPAFDRFIGWFFIFYYVNILSPFVLGVWERIRLARLRYLQVKHTYPRMRVSREEAEKMLLEDALTLKF